MSDRANKPDSGPMQPPSVFLERQSYRRRRLMDAARLMPLLGAALFTVPLLWPTGPEEAPSLSTAMIYAFGVWALLIAVSVGFGFAARRSSEEENTGAERD